MPKDKVYVIGVSPEGAQSLSSSALQTIKRAEVVYGGNRLLCMFRLPGTDKVTIGSDLAALEDSIRTNFGRKRMVVLASGDPGFFGIAKLLIEKLGKDAIEIMPNVSSMQLAFARIKESWEDATFVSAHARPIEKIVEAVRSSSKVAVLTDNKNTPGRIAAALLGAGINDCRVYVCQDLGSARELIINTDLTNVGTLKLSPLCIMILLGDSTTTVQTGHRLLGIPEAEFCQRHGRSLITKQEVRAVSLAKLRLTNSSVVWDIGAGSGSISIEASVLAGNGIIFAVEKNSADTAIIRKNIERFERHNIRVVQASAPYGLTELPDPSAIFIGGSGGKLASILDYSCQRLKRGGRVVCNLATLENVNLAAARLKANGYKTEITLINIARNLDIAGLTRLEPLNPVFIITGTRSVIIIGKKKGK